MLDTGDFFTKSAMLKSEGQVGNTDYYCKESR